MQFIQSITELETHYGEVSPGALAKVLPHISPLYQQWIEASRFLILSTVGEAGTDASPRGDVGPVVRIVDPSTLWLPDWMGNNRMDSLRNLVSDGRVSLMFMVPGSNNVVRVNGTAVVTADQDVLEQFEQRGKHPRTVIVITVKEIYFQCAKALMRSQLWVGPHNTEGLPTAGQFIAQLDKDLDAAAYDAGYAAYAEPKMW